MVKKFDTDATTLRTDPVHDQAQRTSAAGNGSINVPARLRDLFVLEEHLGDGGMGTVYKALDLKRSKYDDPKSHVALKILRSEVLQQFPDAALALQREASRAMELSHPNIVRIYGFYDLDPADNACFITMELLQGKPLDALIRKHPRGLAPRHALFLLEQICAGLQYAHDQRLLHSDLKPGNIFVTDEGAVKVLDFGIATPLRGLKDARVDTLYNPRQLGALTPAYASLEQWDRMPPDPRDDVYSLGCIAYEMLSGEHPFGRADARKACSDAMRLKPIRKLTAHQNRALRDALTFRREDRTRSVEQFCLELTESRRLPAMRTVALGSIAAVAIAATVLWVARDGSEQVPQSSMSESKAAAAETQAAPRPSGSESMPASQSLTPADEFTGRCQLPATSQSLQQLLDKGLDAQAAAALAQGEAELKTAEASVNAIADCILALHRQQIRSPQSEQWLEDVAPTQTP